MDEEDRYSASSGESERNNENENENENENDADEVMEDPDEGDAEEENNDDEDEEEAENDDNEGDNDNENADDNERDPDTQTSAAADGAQTADGETQNEGGSENPDELTDRQREKLKASTPHLEAPPGSKRPTVRPEALTARLYDIVPTMAAPQATSVNAMAVTPDLRYWFTGGSDGYIRKYDGPGTINGKLPLTVAQKHPFVDSVTKAGILMSYWENEEPSPPGRSDQEHVLSPVYSLAVHSDALWLLSGLESGGINLQSVRHDEGKKIHCLQRHSNAVSVLTLAQDETSVLSGSWDKNIFDWDLNTGQVKRSFDGSGGQIAAIELRPAGGYAIPAVEDEPAPSYTISTNNGAPTTNGSLTNGNHFTADDAGTLDRTTSFGGDGDEGAESPAHESLFGGSDAGSLFGETAGGQAFAQDEDEYNGSMSMMPGHEHEGGMDHSADMAMAGMDMGKEADTEPAAAAAAATAAAPAVQPPPSGDAMDVDPAPSDKAQPPTANGIDQTAASSQTEMPDEQTRVAQELKREDDDDDDNNNNNNNADGNSQPQPPKSPVFASSNEYHASSDPSQTSPHTFLSAAVDGTIRIWDRRVQNPVTRIGSRPGVPPWCMSACWSPDGNMIYAGRRNGTVEEFDIRKARRGWEPERVLKFPAGSGAVSAVKPMPNGRHLVW
jgi:transcriptional activator SPT8